MKINFKLGYIISLNHKIIKAINGYSSNSKGYVELFDEILLLNESTLTEVLTRRCFIWNIMRPKDFYRMFSLYIVDNLRDEKNLSDKIEKGIQCVLKTTKSETVKRTFIRSIVKQVPLLTVDTLPYCTKEWLIKLLDGEMRGVIADEYIGPFLTRIIELEVRTNVVLTSFLD